MPEIINDKKIFSLFEVTKSIQKTIDERYKSSYWIKAELNKLNYYQHSGHCYPELVEKKDGKVIAQLRSNLWKTDFININNNFKRVLNEPLKDGIKILFLASIQFHPEYGLSLNILDIDPSFTLGDLEKEKQETIQKLKQEGIYDANKKLKIPLIPQRIAIISVETSKGYADFLKILEGAKNSWGYRFFYILFPSLLQGDNAPQSIIGQLKRIRKIMHHFDVVVIVRGGGGDIGLSCFNNYELAKEIAIFPIPVITGIGHATNETVTEMIAFTNAITPTKIAEFLIQKFHDFSVPVQKAEEKIIDMSKRLIADEQNKFTSEVKLFRSVTNNMLLKNKNVLNENAKSLVSQSQFIFKNEYEYHKMAKQKIISATKILCNSLNQGLLQNEKNIKRDMLLLFKTLHIGIENIEKNINNMKPENVLKRGYSITYLNGKSVSTFKDLKEGDILKTSLNEGSVTSIVNKISNNE
ncbi:MAG TPA: exodeoxyribonuclease VII large subunit [Chitinophagaceae bacterium]|nr:exodeoxyribonuclease VII large subunit [Chitinophagaceae bacterium]